jgi:hypothetical protein
MKKDISSNDPIHPSVGVFELVHLVVVLSYTTWVVLAAGIMFPVSNI